MGGSDVRAVLGLTRGAQILIVNRPTSCYGPLREPLDQAGAVGPLYHHRAAFDRMGRESIPNGSPVASERASGEGLNMHEVSFEEALDLIQTKDPRYTRDAYLFVREALDHTQKSISKDSRGRIRHVTGQELLAGIRDFALVQFGPMAMFVLEEWGIRACADFGEIVFNMVEIGLLAKTDKDSRADFAAGYDFAEAFRKPFLPSDRQRYSERTPAGTSGN
jgi:uncharacterized repeat protein (TIGR04138 family)